MNKEGNLLWIMMTDKTDEMCCQSILCVQGDKA